MGWTYTPNISFKAFVDHLNKDWTLQSGKNICIKHCYRGNPSGGRLWQVRKVVFNDGKTETYISLYLIRYEKGYGWGEKHMDEEMGPYYYDCPLKYLDLVPCPKSKSATEWRTRVYAYHNERVAKRIARKEAKKKQVEVKFGSWDEMSKKMAETVAKLQLEGGISF